MTFVAGAIRVFDKAGYPLGDLRGFTVVGPRTYRLNDVEDFSFSIPRNDGPVTIIGTSQPATLIGSTYATATAASLGPLGDGARCSLPNPAGTAVGDTLIATVTFPGGSAGGFWSEPDGWTLLRRINNGTSFGQMAYMRKVTATDPVSRAWVSKAIGTMSVQIATFRGMFRVRTQNWMMQANSFTSRVPDFPLRGGVPNSTRLDLIGVSAPVTMSGSGASTNVAGAAAQAAHIIMKPVPVEGVDSTTTLTAGSAVAWTDLYLVMDPVYGVEQLLMRDNLVFVAGNSQLARGWGGFIDNIDWSGGSVSVTCLGTMGLLSRLSTSTITQDGGEAATVAARLVAAANAKKAAHGDLQVQFQRDHSWPLYGKFEYEGDILRGIAHLLDSTTSEAWVTSWIGSDGMFNTRLYWGKEYDEDMTTQPGISGNLLVLKDGPGGNLTPGTEISFSGSERANFGRLVGARTDFVQHLNYDAVGAVLVDLIPEATYSVDEGTMPGARRREILDLSVDWGLSTADQKKLAQQIEDKYLDYYKRFLYAYHDRFGMPFLDGFDWSGPDEWQARKLSSANYRTFSQLAFLGSRTVVHEWDPGSDSDVSLEGWHAKSEQPTGVITGMAFNFQDPRRRWQAIDAWHGLRECIISVSVAHPHDGDEDAAFSVALAGETVQGIANDGTEPSAMWVLTRNTGLSRSTVRRWDIETRTALSEWHTPGILLNDIAVDVAEGFIYTIGGSQYVTKRDINSGQPVPSYGTGTPPASAFVTSPETPVGISISGGVGYIAGAKGMVEMRFLDDGARAGSKNIGQPMVGIYVDALNAEVWAIHPKGVIRDDQPGVTIYSAAVAIAVTGGNQPVDGAPGFPELSKGAFGRIVMSDDRNIGSFQDEAPKSNQIKDVHHLNQHGYYNSNHKWVLWPPTDWPSGPSIRHSGNCAPTSACMLLERHTYGKKRVTPPVMRRWTGQHNSKVGMDDIVKAWKHYDEDLHSVYRGKWSDLYAKLKEGRGIILSTTYRYFGKYKCQSNFNDGHSVYLHRLNSNGTIAVNDPLCRKQKNIPISVLRKAAAMYAGGTLGRATFGWSRDTTHKVKVDLGKSETVYMVWSEGKWKTQYSPGAPGEPVQTARVWDPGDQKKGYKKRKDVKVAKPDQVIWGEEGRVSDWDPVSMGYGKYYNNKDTEPLRAYYRTGDGNDTAYDWGWHLVPWDVPLSAFQLPAPDWPEGRAFLKTRIDKFNREQGQQSLQVINRDGLWNYISLGARFRLVKSLDGPHTQGISGQVRVREYAPDEANGTVMLLTEWVG